MMAASPYTYRRLPGRRRRVGVLWTATRYSLWLGADHLLQVENRLCSEEYRRFYYRDIQMLMVRRTRHWIVWNILFALLAGGGVWWGIQTGEFIGQSIGAAVTTVFLLALLGNALYGPTCACHLRTAVQTVALPSCNRLRYINKAFALIQPLIGQAQGELPPDVLASELATVGARPASLPTAGQRPRAQATRLLPFHGTRHAWLFGLLLLDGGVTLYTFLHHSVFVVLGSWGGMLGIFVALVLALVFQQQSDCPKNVRWLTWVVGVYICLLYIVRTIPMTLLSFKTSDMVLGHSLWDMMQSMMVHSPWQSAYVYTTSLMAFISSLGLGVFGCYVLAMMKRQQHVPPAVRLAATPTLEE